MDTTLVKRCSGGSPAKGVLARLLLSCLLALVLPVAGQASAKADLRGLIDAGQTSVAGVSLHAPTATGRFYQLNRYQAAWSKTEQMTALMTAIASAEQQGLRPQNYHLAMLNSPVVAEPAVRDILATDAWLSLAGNILGGQLDPVSMEPDWTAARRDRDLATLLIDAVASQRIAETLIELEPDAPEYVALKQELSRLLSAPLQAITAFPDGKLLKPGKVDERLPQLCEALQRFQFSCAVLPERYDGGIVDAVKRVQARAGLEADGIIGPATVRLLNQSNAQRIRQLRVNLERWRWLPENLGERHIRVNIADFALRAVTNGKVEREHPVIIGRNYRQTPVFSGQIRYLVFNPWWETPASIARKDKLPEFKADPSKVKQQGFELRDTDGNVLNPDSVDWRAYSSNRLPIRMRQRPGPNNALGKVKIMFPNAHSVYLHDTPGKALFNKTERAFSSGCVRVKDAVDLSRWLLQANNDSDKALLEKSLNDFEELRINLKSPVPVHMNYITTVVNADGSIRYLNDVYDRDDRVAKALGIRADQ